MGFLVANFCPPAHCLGRSHVDDCLTSLQRVHEELFPKTQGNAAQHVMQMIVYKFDVQDIPTGFLYFPTSLGGLEMHNPFISLQAMRRSVWEDPADRVDNALEDNEATYRQKAADFDEKGPADVHAMKEQPDTFMPKEEFERFRRERSVPFFHAWDELRRPAEEGSIDASDETQTFLSKLTEYGPIYRDWRSMKPYWRAVVELYGAGMIQTFGGLVAIEKSLLPIGMLDLWKGKVRWEG